MQIFPMIDALREAPRCVNGSNHIIQLRHVAISILFVQSFDGNLEKLLWFNFLFLNFSEIHEEKEFHGTQIGRFWLLLDDTISECHISHLSNGCVH